MIYLQSLASSSRWSAQSCTISTNVPILTNSNSSILWALRVQVPFSKSRFLHAKLYNLNYERRRETDIPFFMFFSFQIITFALVKSLLIIPNGRLSDSRIIEKNCEKENNIAFRGYTQLHIHIGTYLCQNLWVYPHPGYAAAPPQNS